MIKNKGWIWFVLKRFNYADAKVQTASSSIFSIAGIGFGVTALIVILSVMNGFQMGAIDTIIKVSSSHIRLTGTGSKLEKAKNLNLHKSFVIFREAQTLLQGIGNRQRGMLLRASGADICTEDIDFADSFKMASGVFDLETEDAVVLGYELARQLSVQTGDRISVLAVSGSSETDIFPSDMELLVTGCFKTGYYGVDSYFGFTNLKTAEKLLGKTDKLNAAVKLRNPNKDASYIADILKQEPSLQAESWRSYNRVFFGALRIEKNMMMILVVLIFFVVAVNIYNGMRRSIYERREEISVLASLGAHPHSIQMVFVANGFIIGFIGSFVGLLLGLLLSVQINALFSMVESCINGILYFFSILTGIRNTEEFSVFSPVYFYMENIPVRIFFSEVAAVFLFGVFSSSIAAWIAAKRIVMLKPAEVLRYE